MSSTFGGNLGSSPETEYNFSYKPVKRNGSNTYSRIILQKLKFAISNFLSIKEKHAVAQNWTAPRHQKKQVWPKKDLVLKRVDLWEKLVFLAHVFKTMRWHTNKALLTQLINKADWQISGYQTRNVVSLGVHVPRVIKSVSFLG